MEQTNLVKLRTRVDAIIPTIASAPLKYRLREIHERLTSMMQSHPPRTPATGGPQRARSGDDT